MQFLFKNTTLFYSYVCLSSLTNYETPKAQNLPFFKDCNKKYSTKKYVILKKAYMTGKKRFFVYVLILQVFPVLSQKFHFSKQSLKEYPTHLQSARKVSFCTVTVMEFQDSKRINSFSWKQHQGNIHI